MKDAFDNDGYYLCKGLLGAGELDSLKARLEMFDGKLNSYGIRDLMRKVPVVRDLAISSPLIDRVREILGDEARPVRSVYFDKPADANWNVAWHQDTSVALQEKHEVPGFAHWSEKQGVVHAEPPEGYLSNMLTLRIHLDRSNADTGGLRVVPGTHGRGRIGSAEILATVERSSVVECDAEPGDVLLMSPLLFHSSRKATHPSHRRIIHIEYSGMPLPAPLQWHECA